MLRKILVALATALGVVACAAMTPAPPAPAERCAVPALLPPPAPPAPACRSFVVSSAFTPNERAILGRAVHRWNEIAIERFCLEDEDAKRAEDVAPGGIFRVRYRGDTWQGISDWLDGLDWYGAALPNGQIALIDTLGPDLFEETALHELGHAHGLAHTHEMPSIMFPAIGSAWDFTPIDIAECLRVGACATPERIR